jgi:hypothetical protein
MSGCFPSRPIKPNQGKSSYSVNHNALFSIVWDENNE